MTEHASIPSTTVPIIQITISPKLNWAQQCEEEEELNRRKILSDLEKMSGAKPTSDKESQAEEEISKSVSQETLSQYPFHFSHLALNKSKATIKINKRRCQEIKADEEFQQCSTTSDLTGQDPLPLSIKAIKRVESEKDEEEEGGEEEKGEEDKLLSTFAKPTIVQRAKQAYDEYKETWKKWGAHQRQDATAPPECIQAGIQLLVRNDIHDREAFDMLLESLIRDAKRLSRKTRDSIAYEKANKEVSGLTFLRPRLFPHE